MRRTMVGVLVVAIAFVVAPAQARHEDGSGYETCDYAHDTPHYGAWRDDPDDLTSWPSEGDPDNPWVGSTSPSGSVYAGRFGGSDGRAWLSAGTCLEHQGAGSHGGTTEAAVYEEDGSYHLVVILEGGNDNAAANGYIGLNTGYGGANGKANSGGPACAGERTGANACTPVDTPLICEPASSAGGPAPDEGGADWHRTDADGCDLRN